MRARLTGRPFWATALALLSVGIMSVLSLLRYEGDAYWVTHTYRVIEQAQALLAEAVEMQNGLRGFVITGDDRSLEPYWKARSTIQNTLKELRELTVDSPVQQNRIGAIEAQITERLTAGPVLIELRRNGGFAKAQAAVSSGPGQTLLSGLRASVSEVVFQERALLSDRHQRSDNSARLTLGAIVGLGSLGLGVLGVTAARIRREIDARAAAQARAEQLNVDLERQAKNLAAEVAVRQAAEEAARGRNEELKGFAYTVSHDLKAPLRGISGYAQELERLHQAGLPDRARFCVTQIITAARNLDSLIDDLLRYARLDAESLKVSKVNLAELVEGLLRDRKHTIAEGGIVVRVEVPPSTVRVWERGLHQVLSNLIDNAIKYSRHSTPPTLTIEGHGSSEGFKVSVADNGIGFDMKYHDRIFGLFNRLVRASEFEGTGAGLAIAKKVVDKLGGTLQARSAPGQGATFFVDVPSPNPERGTPT